MTPYLHALLVTLMVELPVVVGASPRGAAPTFTLAVAVAANLLTHGSLWVLFPYVSLPYAVSALVFETLITLTEAALLAGVAGWRWRDALLVSAAANATSTAVGLCLAVGR